MNKLSDYKSKIPAVVGSTTINHASRIRLSLNCSEYVMLDYLARCQTKGIQVDSISIYIHTGFSIEAQEAIMRALMVNAWIYIKNEEHGKPLLMVSDRWMDSAVDIEKEFDKHFWKENDKVVWTGTRKKALEYYIRLRKKY